MSLHHRTLFVLLPIVLTLLLAVGLQVVSGDINRWTSNGPEGGKIVSLAVDPTTPTTLYAGTFAGSFNGGVFKSTDSGASWTSINIGLPNTIVNTIEIDPLTPTTVYVGTGGDGLFKSTNAGASWTSINIGLSDNFVTAIAINPTTPTIMYAACLGAFFKSTNSGATWSLRVSTIDVRDVAIDPTNPTTIYFGAHNGVWKNTTGGDSGWTLFSNGLPNAEVYSLAIDPSTSTTVYVGTEAGIFKSTNGGSNWTAINTGLPGTTIRALVINPLAPTTIYAACNSGVFKSTNGGGSWSTINTGLFFSFVGALAINNAIPTIIYTGTSYGVFKSTNSGDNWSAINMGLIGSTVQALAIDPLMVKTIYSASNEGISKSTDGGHSWLATGFTSSTVSSVVIDPTTTATVYAGGVGAVFKSTNGGFTWEGSNLGLPNTGIDRLTIDPAIPARIYAGTSNGVFKSTNGGGTWTAVNSGLTSTQISALAIDPITPTTIYAGTQSSGVFKSTNGGGTWNNTNNGLANTFIKYLAINPVNADNIYAGTSGGVFKSNNGAGSWIAINSGLTSLQISALAIDPITSTTVYAGTQSGVFKSINGGDSWEIFNNGLTYPLVSALAIDSSGTYLHAGTSGGGVFDYVISTLNIISISPTSPLRSSIDQSVIVNGSGFQQNLTVTITFPSGASTILSGTQIQNVTVTSFKMRITLNAIGTWSIRVNNPDGGQSNSFNFNVQSVIVPPTISAIDPSVPFASANDQDILVLGSGFQENLTVSVNFPNGGGTTISGSQVLNLTASSFVMRVTLNGTGIWGIRANNPDGGQSSTFNFSVQPAGIAPVISAIDPVTPVTKNTDQNVTINGGNFQPGLTVNVTFPSGGQATLRGSAQIQAVTSNSFLMRVTFNGEGTWSIRAVNPNGTQSNLFSFTVQQANPPPANIPSSILSPVIGGLRVTSFNQHISDGKWEFNQHQSGLHRPSGGISASNDTYAWDVNLYTPTNSNEDSGQAVYSVSDGDVVSYAGVLPGARAGAVLIAHPNKDAPVWWSGYLHMKNIKVSLNDRVSQNTVIGDIGMIGADNDHLHFVVYYGQNVRGGLISFNTVITERGTVISQLPTISSISPTSPIQGDNEQDLTINGNSFQQGLAVSVGFPDGSGRTLTPVSISNAKQQSDPRILSVTSTSILIRMPVTQEGTWTMRVNNPDGGQSSPFACYVQRPSNLVAKTPLIFIPGVMGSYLDKVENGNRTNLWPGGIRTDHRELTLDQSDSSFQGNTVEATNALLADTFGSGLFAKTVVTYQPLLDMLADPSRGGYRYYNVNNDPNRRTTTGCDLNQAPNNPTLFVFAYDWRKSNAVNVQALGDYIGCIRRFYPNSNVDILTHSMGGLLARRYILNNSSVHHVNKLITIAAPWLGAPKAVNVLETGQYPDITPLLVLPGTLKSLGEFFPGVHELLPSRAYFTLGGLPFREEGWDINGDGQSSGYYNPDQLVDFLNSRHLRSQPGTNGRTFHDTPGQDDWRNDQSGVQYYHFYGMRKNPDTIGAVIAKTETICTVAGICSRINTFSVSATAGDQTVPTLSARRSGNSINLNAPGIVPRVFADFNERNQELFNHIGLTQNPSVLDAIRSVLSSSQQPAGKVAVVNEPAVQPAYYLRILGTTSVTVEDEFGNTIHPLSDTPEDSLPGVTSTTSSDRSLLLTFPTDQIFTVTLDTSTEPISIDLTQKTDTSTTQAVRYQDLLLPGGVSAQILITPQGVDILRYDSDGDGVFETPVTPTVSVIGTAAQDTDPPIITISAIDKQAAISVTLTAQDPDSGVRRIFYSFDSTQYQLYTAPIIIDPTRNPTLYAFADDNLANRSSLYTFNILPVISPTSQLFTQNGADGSFNVTALSGLGWTAVSNDQWITITSEDSGNGNGNITFIVRDNFTNSSRTGTITVARQTFTVIQNGGLGEDCLYSISPVSTSIPASGGTGSIQVTADSRCAWQSTTNNNWITIISGNIGIGNSTMTYSVATNPSASGRKGSITVAGKTFSIKQKGN